MTEEDIQWMARHVPHAILWLEVTLVGVWWLLIALADAQP